MNCKYKRCKEEHAEVKIWDESCLETLKHGDIVVSIFLHKNWVVVEKNNTKKLIPNKILSMNMPKDTGLSIPLYVTKHIENPVEFYNFIRILSISHRINVDIGNIELSGEIHTNVVEHLQDYDLSLIEPYDSKERIFWDVIPNKITIY
jgi:hypothetical protein